MGKPQTWQLCKQNKDNNRQKTEYIYKG